MEQKSTKTSSEGSTQAPQKTASGEKETFFTDNSLTFGGIKGISITKKKACLISKK